jgi:hypothetical protein
LIGILTRPNEMVPDWSTRGGMMIHSISVVRHRL